MFRVFLATIGIVSLVLGIIGIVLPLLPTTPFLLLSAACFSRSSTRFHRMLMENRFAGETIRRFQSGEGLPLGTKVRIICLSWMMLGLTAWWAVSETWLRGLLVFIAVTLAAYLFWLPSTEATRPAGGRAGE